MLNAHPDMAIPHESYFVVSYGRLQRQYQLGNDFDWRKLGRDLLSHRWFCRWGIDETELTAALAARSPTDFSEAMRVVYALYAGKHGKRRYGDKTPDYVLNMPLLARLFPEARFLHIVRDGRDVALSLLDVQFGPDRVDEAAMFWSLRVARGLEAGLRLGPDRYREVRYEDLIAEPERIVASICTFVGLTFSSAMLDYSSRAGEVMKDFRHPEEQRNLLLPPTKGLRDWRTQMSRDDLARFEAIAGNELAALGYERSVHKIPLRLQVERRRTWARVESKRIGRALRRRVRGARQRLGSVASSAGGSRAP
jgi:hypothetical protein